MLNSQEKAGRRLILRRLEHELDHRVCPTIKNGGWMGVPPHWTIPGQRVQGIASQAAAGEKIPVAKDNLPEKCANEH